MGLDAGAGTGYCLAGLMRLEKREGTGQSQGGIKVRSFSKRLLAILGTDSSWECSLSHCNRQSMVYWILPLSSATLAEDARVPGMLSSVARGSMKTMIG